MSTYDLEEQEQLAALKSWWNQYGNRVLLLATACLLGIAAWNGWNWYLNSQALQAAALYETLQKAERANDLKAARDAAGTLLENYSGTVYGPLGALVAAKINFQAGDLKTAKAQLQWVVDEADDPALKALARLRLAHVLVDEKAFDEALKVLSATPAPGFEALFEATRGDVFLVQKKIADARNAYAAALQKADKDDVGLREQLRLKMEALSGEG